MTRTVDDLRSALERGPYQSYVYSYPHKSAYRELDPSPTLADLWRDEDCSRLFLYAHVPFCDMRCGFCNLFTVVQPRKTAAERYLHAFARHVEATAEALPPARFSRFAVGGGTPTWLSASELVRFLDTLARGLDVVATRIPSCIEASPSSLDDDKIALLKEQGFERVSIGVQTFDEEEARQLGRPQATSSVHRALASLVGAVPILNVDLIYGGERQTAASWQRSVAQTLEYAPQEVYLYPLYVRPLTGPRTTSTRVGRPAHSAVPAGT